MNLTFLSVLAVLVVTLPFVHAFGVSPASTSFQSPDDEQYALRIINNKQESATIRLVPEGPVAPFITLGTEQVILTPDVTEVRVPITVHTPERSIPGTYTGGIIIEQVPETVSRAEFVTAVPAYLHHVTVIVPAEGKHLIARFSANIGVTEEEQLLTVSVQNVGTEYLRRVHARIEIRSPTNELLDTRTTTSLALAPKEEQNLVVAWNPPSTGNYAVRAVVTFDGLTTVVDDTFTVGELDVTIGSLTFGPFRLGDVVRVDLPVTSAWNSRLRDVYAVFTYTTDTTRGSFSSLSHDLPPLGDAMITAYWNTAGLPPGVYNLSATLVFGHREKTRDFPVVLGVDDIRLLRPGNPWLLWTEIGVLLLAIGFFVWLTRHRLRKRQKTS